MAVKRAGITTTGVYTISLDNGNSTFQARCDMDTDGGGWLVRHVAPDNFINYVFVDNFVILILTYQFCIIMNNFQVFQRRIDGRLDFYKSWRQYKYGFGNPENNYWLGMLRTFTFPILSLSHLQTPNTHTTEYTSICSLYTHARTHIMYIIIIY